MNIKAMSITLVRQLQLNMFDVILEVTADQKNMQSFDENVHFDMGTTQYFNANCVEKGMWDEGT